MKSQLRLPLARPAAYARADFVVSPVNAEAVTALWKSGPWPGPALALVGPEGSGKTHLAKVWAAETRASTPKAHAIDFTQVAGRSVLIEDADQWDDGEGLFHLLNAAADSGARVLLTARTRPSAWPAAVPDLRSRLNALPVIELAEPDDAILSGVIMKLFKECHVVPAHDLIPYLLPRIERSVPALRGIIAALDEKAAAERREVNRALASDMFKVETVTIDMFEAGPEQ